MIYVKVVGVAVLVPILFIIAEILRNSMRGVATGKGAIAGTLVSPWFLTAEVAAIFLAVHFSR
jgi:hypothetical protein